MNQVVIFIRNISPVLYTVECESINEKPNFFAILLFIPNLNN